MATAASLRAQEDRLKHLLSLGLRTPTSSEGRGKFWANFDAEMQLQTVRAIQSYVNSHKSKLQSIERNLLDDIISALEGLLKAKMEQIYSIAVDVVYTLINSGGISIFGLKSRGVFAPLVHLLLCNRENIVITCAMALRVLITNLSKSRTTIGSEDDLWKAFKDANMLNILTEKLQIHERIDGEGSLLYVSLADLLSTIFQFFPLARYSSSNRSDFQKCVLCQTLNINEDVSRAALRLCAASALCGGVASVQVQQTEALSLCFITNTSPSRSYNIRSEAFHFLYILTRSCSLCVLLSESAVVTIGKNITDVISQGVQVSIAKWRSGVKNLVLKASQAAQGLLHMPGNHHYAFWKAGFAISVCNLLLHLYEKESLKHYVIDTASSMKSTKYDVVLAPVLLDALGWLFINAPILADKTLMRIQQQTSLISRIADFSCAVLLEVVDRRGSQLESKNLQDHCFTGVEGVLICKMVLFLLYSPSHHLTEIARCSLERLLQQHGYDWLPSFVRKLSLTLSSEAATENMITVMTLVAVSCLSVSLYCRNQMLEHGVLDVLIHVVKEYSFKNTLLQTPTAAASLYMPVNLNVCCWNKNTWEGDNPILFFSLWGFFSLARRSSSAKIINTALKKRLSNSLDWGCMPDEEVDSYLLVLAGSRKVAAGVRWWASCCLACCGLFGFPSETNQLSKILNDRNTADCKLIFVTGNCLYVHKVVIRTKCPDLLPNNKVPLGEGLFVQLNLSARIQESSMKLLLEFIYAGLVFIDEELEPEIKFLAKRCHMDIFYRLLQGKAPIWGHIPDIHDFSPALGNKGCSFADIFFEASDSCQSGCTAANEDIDHLHAHRVILSAQCNYFEGLFRSGMQDSFSRVLKVPLSAVSLRGLLYYLYSSILPHKQLPEAGCMWSSLCRLDQVKYLKSYVELAQIAHQWLLEDLNEQCVTVVSDLLEKNLDLGPDVIKLANMCGQGRLLEIAIELTAKDYPRIRSSGELDVLDEYLVDAIRVAHVRMSMSCQKP